MWQQWEDKKQPREEVFEEPKGRRKKREHIFLPQQKTCLVDIFRAEWQANLTEELQISTLLIASLCSLQS